MTYQAGQIIRATDYNNMVGSPTGLPSNTNKVAQPFANNAEAINKVAALYGIGYGDRGYGQSSVILPNKNIGEAVTAAEWSALRTAIETVGNHNGADLSNLVPGGVLVSGQDIEAHDGTNFSLSNLISIIDDRKLLTDSGASMTLSSNAQTNQRSTTWSGTIDVTFRFIWNSINAARFFFNSGGELRIRLTQENVSTPQDSDWNDIFTNKLGTYAFRAQDSTITGSATSSLVINSGYYDISNGSTYTTAFNGTNLGGGAYSSNDLIIHARVQGTQGNGAPGEQVDIKITLQDQHTNVDFDQVSSGTTGRVDLLRATAVLSGIEVPTVTVFESFN